MFAYTLASKPCSEATNIGDRLPLAADCGCWSKIGIYMGMIFRETLNRWGVSFFLLLFSNIFYVRRKYRISRKFLIPQYSSTNLFKWFTKLNHSISNPVYLKIKTIRRILKFLKHEFWFCYNSQSQKHRNPILHICGLGASVGCERFKRTFNMPRLKSQIGGIGFQCFVSDAYETRILPKVIFFV